MTDLLGQGERFLRPLLGLLVIAKPPQNVGYPAEVCGLEIMATMEGRGGGLRESLAREGDVSHVLTHTFNFLISLSIAHYQQHLWNTIHSVCFLTCSRPAPIPPWG